MWLILKIVCWEQINEVLYPFFPLKTLAASSKLLHSLPTFQICSHPAESLCFAVLCFLFFVCFVLFCLLMQPICTGHFSCLGAKVSVFL